MVDLGIAENYDDIIKDIKWEYSPDQINKYLSSESQQQEAEKENTWMSRLMRRAVVHARIYIDLELRFSKEMSAWVPSLAQRFHLLDNIETSLENNESLIFCNSKGKAAKLISTSDDHEEALCGLMLYEETLDDGSIEEIWGLFIVYLWGSDSLPEEYEDLRHLRFVNGEDFYDFTHQGYTYSEDGVVHETCIPLGSSNSGYTPAPGGSLADIMLTNMAYANDDERIDSLLVKDAEKKFKFLKNLEREQLAEYTTCMAKTLSDG